MTQIINSAAALGDHGHGPFQREPEAPAPHAEAQAAAAEPAETADVRLIIEHAEDGDGFLYPTVDHRTGEVLRQLPRERLLKLGQASDYAAGALIKTRV
jgi:flagellar protein FlaG